jgi:transposase-like protein
MRKKRSFTAEFKLEQVLKYTKHHQSYCSISKEIGIAKSVIRRWVGLYKSKGVLGLEINKTVVLHRLVDFKVNYFSLYFNISYGVFPLKEP